MTIYMVNHTNKYLEWEEGKTLGLLKRTEELLTATHICTGDPIYGREEEEWYTGKASHDILTTCISLNQQENIYRTEKGGLAAGPAPETPEICHVSIPSTQANNKEPEPIIVTGNFKERYLFRASDVIVQQVNATTVGSHGLSRELENSYPYGTIYKKKTSKNNILPEEQTRPIGGCILSHDQNESNPMIANLISQYFYGRATDDKGRQEDYITKFADKCGGKMIQQLREDTRENRLKWFRMALEELKSMLKYRQQEKKERMKRIFFPKMIGCAKAHGEHIEYMKEIEQFTTDIRELNIAVYLVVHPKENKEEYEDKYPLITPATTITPRHQAGRYSDAPTTFCKDPSCRGCHDNKAIIGMLSEGLEEEDQKIQPMTGIQDGMSPDTRVPVARSEEEREYIFEEMLQNIQVGNLDKEQLIRVKDLLRRFSKLFITSEFEPAGKIIGLEADLPIKGPPISCKMRRFSPKALKIMEELNQTMLRKGLTRPCDGPWSSPVVLVKKKNTPGLHGNGEEANNYRFCVDYRRVNESAIVWKAYPVANLKQQLQESAGFIFYSTLDINSAFHCVALRKASQDVTAFALPSGLWCFTRLPFGLSISPQIWAKAADTMLRPVSDICGYYADDIVCRSYSFDQHMADVQRVLQRVIASGVKVQIAKCAFFMEKVTWLGHVLSREGISPDPKGVETVKNLGAPQNISELRSVIGSFNYFKDFLPGYADAMAPMTELLKKRKKFEWGETQDKALQILKDALTSRKVLIKPDFEKDFFLQCDASDEAVSCVLSQQDGVGRLRPIQYWSKKLTKTEKELWSIRKRGFGSFSGI